MGQQSDGQIGQTPEQAALTQHAVNLMQDYKQRWQPMQQQLSRQVLAEGAPNSAAAQLAEGKVGADTASQFAQTGGVMGARLSDTGAMPGSSKANLATSELGNAQAAAKGTGLTMADQHIQDAYTQGLASIMATGRNQSQMAGQSMGRSAAMSGQQAEADAQASQADKMGKIGLLGTGVGYALQSGLGGTGGVSGTNDLSFLQKMKTGGDMNAAWGRFGVGGD